MWTNPVWGIVGPREGDGPFVEVVFGDEAGGDAGGWVGGYVGEFLAACQMWGTLSL